MSEPQFPADDPNEVPAPHTAGANPPVDQRPGVVEPQPDTLQPDVQALPDMSALPSDRFEDAEAVEQDQAQRDHIIAKKNAQHP